MANNKWGLDADYISKNLDVLLRDVKNYTPEEMGRALRRLADTASDDPKQSLITAHNERMDAECSVSIGAKTWCPEYKRVSRTMCVHCPRRHKITEEL